MKLNLRFMGLKSLTVVCSGPWKWILTLGYLELGFKAYTILTQPNMICLNKI